MYRFSKFEKPVFDYYSLYPKKCGLSKKLKVFLLDIQFPYLYFACLFKPRLICLFVTDKRQNG